MYFNIPILKKIYKLLKPFRKYDLIIIFSIIMQQLFFNINSVIYGKLIDSLTHKDLYNTILFIIVIIITVIIIDSSGWLESYMAGVRLRGYQGLHVRSIILPKLLQFNIKQYNNISSIKIAEETSIGLDASLDIKETFIRRLLSQFSYIIIAIAVLFLQNIYIGIISVILLIIVSSIENRFIKYIQPLVEDKIRRNINFSKLWRESISNLSLFKYLGVTESLIKDIYKADTNKNNQSRSLAKKQEIFWGIRDYIISFSATGIVFFAVYLYWSGHISQGVIIVIIFSIWGVLNTARQIQQTLSELSELYEKSSKLFKILDIEPEFQEGGNIGFANNDIVFKNVSFSYNENSVEALSNINITIPQNKRVAFVGHSGSGKSTIIKLLLRAFDYNNGSIRIGNTELKDFEINSLRQNIGYVEQHVTLLDNTLKHNLLIGLSHNDIDKLEKSKELIPLLDNICEMSRISQFYHRLGEEKLESIVGEKGIKLSGGEVQRVGIARAIIRDPKILILDEATSSLDSINEKYITEAVNEVSKNRTTIIIAHRLSTIINSDIIFVMNKGSVVGRGTHNELLENCAEYIELVNHQEFIK